MMSVLGALQSAVNDKSSNTDHLFVTINASIRHAAEFFSTNNRTVWSSVMNASTLPDSSNTVLALRNISNMLNNGIYAKLISIGATNSNTITPAAIFAVLPQAQLSEFSNVIKQLRQFEQTVTLPFVQNFVNKVSQLNARTIAYVSIMSSTFSNLDTTLRQSWSTASALPERYIALTEPLYKTGSTMMINFVNTISAFTDIYLGSSAQSSSSAIEMFYSKYITVANEQTDAIVSKLDRFRNTLCDQILNSASRLMNNGFQAIESIRRIVFLQATIGFCTNQSIQQFINGYASILASTRDCIVGQNFELTGSVNMQSNVASNIQSDMQYFLKLLNEMLKGVSNGSPPSVRIMADANIKAVSCKQCYSGSLNFRS